MEDDQTSTEADKPSETPVWLIKGMLVFMMSVLIGVTLTGPIRLGLEWGSREYPAWDGQRMWILLFITLAVAGLITYPVVKFLPRTRHDPAPIPSPIGDTRWGRIAVTITPALLMAPVLLILVRMIRYTMDPVEYIPQSWDGLGRSLLLTAMYVGFQILLIAGIIALLLSFHRRSLRRNPSAPSSDM